MLKCRNYKKLNCRQSTRSSVIQQFLKGQASFPPPGAHKHQEGQLN